MRMELKVLVLLWKYVHTLMIYQSYTDQPQNTLFLMTSSGDTRSSAFSFGIFFVVVVISLFSTYIEIS